MVTVYYSCTNCGLHRQEVHVRLRYTGETLGPWMFAVAHAVGRSHSRLSPVCVAKKMGEVLIPAPDDGSPIGSKDGPLKPGDRKAGGN